MHARTLLAAVCAASITMLLPLSAVRAHHGGAVEWKEEVAGPVTGVATEFVFRFPHVVVYMDVETVEGTQNWGVTTRWTPTILRQHGWARDSIKPGDRLTVTYAPHVSDPTVVQMRTIAVNGTELQLEF